MCSLSINGRNDLGLRALQEDIHQTWSKYITSDPSISPQRALMIAGDVVPGILSSASNMMRIGLKGLIPSLEGQNGLPNAYAEIGVARGDWWSGNKQVDVMQRTENPVWPEVSSNVVRFEVPNEPGGPEPVLYLHMVSHGLQLPSMWRTSAAAVS